MVLPRLLFLLAMLVVAASAALSDRAPSVRASLSRSSATVGDTIAYRIEVSAPEDVRVVMPAPGDRLGDFHVLGRRSLSGGAADVSTEEFVLGAYSPGEHAVPPLPVALVGPQGDTTRLVGDTLFVTVRSVLGEGDETLKDIKGPATAPGHALWPRLTLAAAALAGAVALLLLLRRRRRAPISVPAGPPVPAHVIALERLEKLLESRLLESGRIKEFYTELSDVVRTYVNHRFLLPGPELTTAELARRMEYLGLPQVFRRETNVLLEESDVVKFAKYKPEIEIALSTAKRARSLVREHVQGAES